MPVMLGKVVGEFFTPQTVSKLLARLVMVGKDKINKVYDPTMWFGFALASDEKAIRRPYLGGWFLWSRN